MDALYKQTFNVVLSYMLENRRLIDAGTHLLQIAHELERVGDRATILRRAGDLLGDGRARRSE